MADDIESLIVICEGGLNTTENHLKITNEAPGNALRLVNFEPSLYGGYRRIDGYTIYDTDFPIVGEGVAEDKVISLSLFRDDSTQTDILIATRKTLGENEYKFYRYTFGVGWVAYTHPVRVMTSGGKSVTNIRFATFNFGEGNRIMFVDGVNPPLVFDGLDWYEVVKTNAGGTDATAGGDQILDAPAVIDVFKNHIFLSGDDDSNSVVCHSAPNDWTTWTSAAGGGQIFAGFAVVTIRPFRESLFVFGEQAINKIETEQDTFILKPVTANVGCIARDSVVEIGGDLAFLSPDGIRPVAGTSNIGDVELGTVSSSIHALVTSYPSRFDLSKLTSVVIRNKSQLRYFMYSDEGADDPTKSYGLIGAIRMKNNSPSWEFSEMIGIRASTVESGYMMGVERVFHGDFDGRVFEQEVGNTFDDQPITAIYQTPYYDMEEPTIRKLVRKIFTFLRPEGDVGISLAVRFNWGDGSAPTPGNYLIEAEWSIPKYGDGSTYGEISYGSNEKPVVMTDIQGSGQSVRFSFVTVGSEPSYSIQGFAVDYSLEEHR